MEPQLPSPNLGPQNSPSFERNKSQSQNPETSMPSHESGERQEAHEGQPSGPTDPALQTPVASPPPLPQIQQASPVAQVPVKRDDNPATAADDDLIEREWVDKAKQVIAETRHDPHLQEQAVSKLQADYLQKRYNKTVKIPDESA